MNTKQLTYPSIEEQQQYWINKKAQHDCETCGEHFSTCVCETPKPESNNTTTETREDYQCVFILGSPDAPHLCYQCGKPRLSHDEQSAMASHKPKPKDIGGNELPDRIEANEDFYEVSRNDFDRGDLRDEGRNPDGEGESYAARNV